MEVMTTKVDDVIGTTAHAVSAVLLLLAIVIWSTLKVLGHTLTQRYPVLVCTITVTFFFHFVLLFSRLNQIHASSKGNNIIKNNKTKTSPQLFDVSSLSSVQFQKKIARKMAPTSRPYASSVSRKHDRTDMKSKPRLRKKDRKHIKKNKSAVNLNTFADGKDVPVLPQKLIHQSKTDSLNMTLSGMARKKQSICERCKLIGRKFREKGRPLRKLGNNVNHRALSKNVFCSERKTNFDRHSQLAGKSGNAMMSLCWVGQLSYQLLDIAFYSFLLAISLYNSLTLLAKRMTFNRLVCIFVVSTAVPTFSLILSLLIPVLNVTSLRIGKSCSLHTLKGELHWAVTGPKLICILMSMCLTLISVYQSNPCRSSHHDVIETFYARRAAGKFITLLLLCSTAEVVPLLTEYREMKRWTTSPTAMCMSRLFYGSTGVLTAFLLCFLDTEVLHCTFFTQHRHQLNQTNKPAPTRNNSDHLETVQHSSR